MNRETLDLARKIVADFNENEDCSDLEQAGYDFAQTVVAWAETVGQAGTHAYDLMASYAKADADTTEALIHMTAATVLAKTGNDVAWKEVSFSPLDMDATFRDYAIDATRDGMVTTVRITPKAKGAGLMTQDEDVSDAKPQSEEHVYDRPVWAIVWFDGEGDLKIARMFDRKDAERKLAIYSDATESDPYAPGAAIENRCCVHTTCPAARCNEVTS